MTGEGNFEEKGWDSLFDVALIATNGDLIAASGAPVVGGSGSDGLSAEECMPTEATSAQAASLGT